MRVASAAQMREIERIAIESRGIPSLDLMERAATAVTNTVMRTMAAKKIEKPTVCILCGTGKNGGDGFAIARLLSDAGVKVRVYAVGEDEKRAEDTAANAARFTGEVRRKPDNGVFKADCIIDALFGIGFHGELTGDARTLVELANSRHGVSAPLRVAVDIPSGVNADTGAVEGVAFNAGITVTFTLPKPGLYLLPGAKYAGSVLIANIGIPTDIFPAFPPSFIAMDRNVCDTIMPARRADAHKGDFGRLLLIGGCADYPGAPVMAANAAVRTGAGLVTVAVPTSIYPITAAKLTEAMPRRMVQDKAGRLSPGSLPALLTLQAGSQAVLFGPGLGRSDTMPALAEALLRGGICPMVLDADGLNAVSAHMDMLSTIKRPLILTPHDGEFARLCGGEAPPAEGTARLDCARAFAARYHCILVLKGHRTITASPDGRVFVNTTGNPGMAKGGSGDVLAGVIASFAAQGIDPFLAAAAGAFFHGAAGDACANSIGEYGMTPTDIIGALPSTLRRYNSRAW
ncbi:MAG: NAD(P)H-hydrate dehydratase [Clostridia bacterium]|nr:NAD(P)H-hydrate dehydratase [Clostridia bacterium]